MAVLEQRASNQARTVARTLKNKSTFLRQIDFGLTQLDLAELFQPLQPVL